MQITISQAKEVMRDLIYLAGYIEGQLDSAAENFEGFEPEFLISLPDSVMDKVHSTLEIFEQAQVR